MCISSKILIKTITIGDRRFSCHYRGVECVDALVDTECLVGMVVVDTMVADMVAYVGRAVLVDNVADTMESMMSSLFEVE